MGRETVRQAARPWSRSGLLGTVFAGGFLVWLVAVGVGFVLQDRLVFAGAAFGLGVDVPDPQTGGWVVRTMPRADAPPLTLWTRPGTAPWALLIFHGNRAHPAAYQVHADEAASRGWHVIAPVYRGYAGSPGTPDAAGVRADVRAAWTFARRTLGLRADHIVVVGHSLGGALAAGLAAEVPPRFLVLESTFDSLGAVIVDHAPFLPAASLLRDPFDSAAALRGRSVPVLQTHARHDPVVPFARGQALHDVVGGGTFVVTDARHHLPPIATDPEARAAFAALLDAVSARR